MTRNRTVWEADQAHARPNDIAGAPRRRTYNGGPSGHGGRGMISGVRSAFALLLAVLATGCDRTDALRAALCQRVIPALEDGAPTIGAIEARSGDAAVSLTYRIAGHAEPRRLTCRFADRAGTDRLALTGVETPAAGALSAPRLAMLQIWLGLAEDSASGTMPGERAPPLGASGYLLQQLLNGLVLGAIYCLIAIGYAQVFSLLEIVNFAFGELYMMGAYFALVCLMLVVGSGLETGIAGVALALTGAVALSLPWGWAIERAVYRPLGLARASNAARLIPLVSAIGLSILLQNLVRLGQGNRNKWLSPLVEGGWAVPLGDAGALRIGGAQLAIVALAATACGALWLVVRRSEFGRQQRACAQDRIAAALLGVDVDRVISRTFMLGAALAGVAGASALIYYGEADPSMGDNIGFKALSAAVLGGIGSLAGAMVGGLLIGLAEALWSAYFDGAYRDVVIFAVLIATLIVRPAGLFGDRGKASS
jgi:branched-chain amino acid transport system permease protein